MKDINEIIKILKERCSFYDRKDSHGEFPWDRGYRNGYADALKRVISLLEQECASTKNAASTMYQLRRGDEVLLYGYDAEMMFNLANDMAENMISDYSSDPLKEGIMYGDVICNDDYTGATGVFRSTDTEEFITEFAVDRISSDMCCNSSEIAIKWSVDDVDHVISMFEMKINPELTQQEKMHVLDEVKNHHDAGVGINWDVLHTWIKTLYGDRIVSEYYNA